MKIAGGHSHQITGRGTVHLKFPSRGIKEVSDVLYVHGFRKNILSIGSFTDRDLIACFNNKKCILYNGSHGPIVSEGIQNRRNGLYQLNTSNSEISANLAQMDLHTGRLWHYRLWHISYPRWSIRLDGNVVHGIQYISVHKEICEQETSRTIS